ncbi:MAG: NADH-quinone oxidoreductase subunit L [Alphaproteobacteria bacterium]
MYSAIVFLPLLGAVIAAIFALATSPIETASANGNGHHGDHDSGGDAGAEHGHDQGPGPAEWITTGLLLLCAVLSWVAFFQVGFGDVETFTVPVMTWVHSGALVADWALRIDTLTVVMLVVVTTVSALVHVYSIGYMAHDPHRARFFAYLSLFTFAMLMLVSADNLLQMFFGWEGVGLASYLLIGFWYKRPAANAAAIKAFIVNRVGDFGFALGIFGVFVLFGSIGFDTIFANAEAVATGDDLTLSLFGNDYTAGAALTVVCVLLFLGAMGKSAQVPLHTWLPDAMEGPTPVSALIHAATMVTAGVFMVARLSPIFALSDTALVVVILVGAFTAFFAATVGLVQNDIKRVIAYSTCSQLGYMFVALGVGAYSVAIFHLFTHAFFKALLFLGSGSVIHAVSDEQDMRKMGGLKSHIPRTYWLMIIGTIALTGVGIPATIIGTSGFFSKDAIIEASFASHSGAAGFAFVLLVIAAVFTSFYSWRLIFMTFHGKSRASGEVMEKEFWHTAVAHGGEHGILDKLHHVPMWVKASPFMAMVVGFLTAWWFYIRSPATPKALAEQHWGLYRFLLNKWYFDELYDFLFVRPAKAIGRFLWKKGDGWLIDGFGPDGVSARVLDVTARVVRLQTGYLYHYAFAMLIGVAALVSWMMFAG